MSRSTRLLLFVMAAAVLSPESALARTLTAVERFTKEFPLDVGGEFYIDNPIGNIEITGQDGPGCFVNSEKSVAGEDQAALAEGSDQTQLWVGGDQRVRQLRTLLPLIRNRWTSNVNYVIRVPRSANVSIISHSSNHIRVVGIAGNVTVKNVNGEVRLDGVTGATTIDSVNGNIIVNYGTKPMANADLSTLNGVVMCIVPAEANFEWEADTLRGDYFTTLPVRGRINGTTFRGSVNAPGGPKLSTSSVMGNVILLKKGTAAREARSIRAQYANPNESMPSRPTTVSAGPSAPPVKLGVVQGRWYYSTNVGDVDVGEVRGDARVETGAGSVRLGTVNGSCDVLSLGGPIDLGDVFGPLVARTDGGNVTVRAAREGGQITTGGGIIRVIYAGAPMTLHSGGGDIVVRQAVAAVAADTHSGDINITVDPTARTQKLDAKTIRGNVILNLTPRFGADVDATVLTSNANAKANTIRSDFNGLTIRREPFNGKTRIRATGKINGGGERVELYAEEGEIHLALQSSSPITIAPAR